MKAPEAERSLAFSFALRIFLTSPVPQKIDLTDSKMVEHKPVTHSCAVGCVRHLK